MDENLQKIYEKYTFLFIERKNDKRKNFLLINFKSF